MDFLQIWTFLRAVRKGDFREIDQDLDQGFLKSIFSRIPREPGFFNFFFLKTINKSNFLKKIFKDI